MGMRDINKLHYFNPIEHGDTVTIDGVTWRADNTMEGWRLSIDGTWRTEHPTIKKFMGINDFLAAIIEKCA